MRTDTTYPVTGIGDEGDGVVERTTTHGTDRVHVPGALPGDLIHERDGSLVVEVRDGPMRRAERLCPHFPACGGCRVQHLADTPYRAWKAGRLRRALHGIVTADDPRLLPMVTVPLASRRRAVLTAQRDAAATRLGFHETRGHAVVGLEACAVLRPAIVAALDALRALADVAASGDCRITVLDVGTGLDVAVETASRRRRQVSAAELTAIAGAGRMLRITIDGEPGLQRARPILEVASVAVEPPPGAFVQAVAEAEAAMVAIAMEALSRAKAKRVADLFCGLGTFTLALATRSKVLAADSDRAGIEALAEAARHATGLKPIEGRVRDLVRDPLSPRELDPFDAVVLDPPRAGAKAQAEALARSKVRTVVAVSCNPATLARDLAILLGGGYRLVTVTPIDQFLFSTHLEAVAVLSREAR